MALRVRDGGRRRYAGRRRGRNGGGDAAALHALRAAAGAAAGGLWAGADAKRRAKRGSADADRAVEGARRGEAQRDPSATNPPGGPRTPVAGARARDAAARCPPRGPAVGAPSETLFWAETWLRGRPRRRRLARGGRGVEDATMANSDHDSGPGGSRAVAAAARPRRTWPLGWSGARSVAPTIDDADHSDWEGSN